MQKLDYQNQQKMQNMLGGNDVVVYDKDPENLFEILEQLGKGNYGSVFKGRNK